MNRDATAILPRLPSDVSRESLLAALIAEGAAVVEGALPPAPLERLNTQMAPWFASTPHGEGLFHGARTRRFSALFAKAPLTSDLALHPAILSAIETVLIGPADCRACDRIQLNLTQAIAIDPGESAQVLHRDGSMFPLRLPQETMVNVMWTLDAFTEENGATRIVPGSHKWPLGRRPFDAEICSATAPPGSAIIWLGATLHGGGANQSSTERRGIVISYSLGWLAQAERLLLSIPPETARRLPPRLQQLIGYQVHRPNLGWIEGRDPIQWLKGETAEVASAQDHLPDGATDLIKRLLDRENPPLPFRDREPEQTSTK